MGHILLTAQTGFMYCVGSVDKGTDVELLIAAASFSVLVGDRVDVCRLDCEVEVGDLLFVEVPELPVCCTLVGLSAVKYGNHSAGTF
jgi:hypothetical protein